MFNKLFKKVTGFTLIELLVVMGVLAVLAAGLIAIINPADRVNLANDTKVAADLNQMLGGLLAYAANNNGSFPVLTGGTNSGDGTAGAAVGFGPVQALISSEVNVSPRSVSGYTYAYNCSATACKLGVTQKATKNIGNTTQGGSLCWTSAGGVVAQKSTTTSNAPTNGTGCP